MKLPITIIFIIFVTSSQGLIFKSSLTPLQNRCFFQILDSHQKYEIDVALVSGQSYSLKFDALVDEQQNIWETVYMRQNIVAKQELNLHKIAPLSTTYRFCILNSGTTYPLNYKIQILSGIQLNDLHLLPDNSDAQNLALQISWIQQQQQKLGEMMQRVSGMKTSSKLLSDGVGSKISYFTILFTVLVLILNGFFYIKFKSAMKARKMI